MIEFKEWPKIPRLTKGVCVTEKIDGTNACVVIDEDGNIGAQSRSKLITPESDNYGFARWVAVNSDELVKLGPGHHFGEWWGNGIQRRYGMTEKRFSLFNVGRWADVHGTNEQWGYRDNQQFAPACCYVVPILSRQRVDLALQEAEYALTHNGSIAAKGFMNPEGFVLFMNDTYQKFIIGSEGPKGAQA